MLSISNLSPQQQEGLYRGLYGDRKVDNFQSQGGRFERKGSVNRVEGFLKSGSDIRSDRVETKKPPILPGTDGSRHNAISISQAAVN